MTEINKIRELESTIADLRAQLEAVVAGGVSGRLMPPTAQPAEPAVIDTDRVFPEWVYGPSLFKDWCGHWFGPDSDESYLAKAVLALPLKHTTQPQQSAAMPDFERYADSEKLEVAKDGKLVWYDDVAAAWPKGVV